MYEGWFVNGKLNGHARYINEQGDLYVGWWTDDRYHGKGFFTWGDAHEEAGHKYIGQFENGIRNGYGVYKWPDGRKLGKWKENRKRSDGVGRWKEV